MTGRERAHPSDLLRRIARRYHHVQQEHGREAPAGTTRRRLRLALEDLARRFHQVLGRWVPGGELREAWRRHLYERAPAPEQPAQAAPPLFKGRTEVGARIEIRPAEDGGYDVVVDGALAEHVIVPWHLEPDRTPPVRIGERSCDEIFDAPAQAIDALQRFLARPGSEPPWRWARALLDDGLIDADFALTARGARRIGTTIAGPPPSVEPVARKANFCVLAADAARARILTLTSDTGELVPTLAPLVQVADLTNPERRARDSELFSDTRPGIREGGAGGIARHGVSDRREAHRRDADRRFAESVAEEAAQVWAGFPACRVVVCAAPATLGLLRPALARRTAGPSPHEVRELARDLSRLAAPALHDALAEAALLPPRGRLPAPGSVRVTGPR